MNPYGSNPASTSRETLPSQPHGYVTLEDGGDASKHATEGEGTAGDVPRLAVLVAELAVLAVTLPWGALDRLLGCKASCPP